MDGVFLHGTPVSHVCGPVCVCFLYRSWQTTRAARSRPLETSASLHLETRASQLNSTEIGHPWKMLFKGSVWISQGHSFSRFHSCTVLFCYVCLFVIKLVQLHWMETFIWTYHSICMKLLYWENNAYMYWVKEQLCIKLLVAEAACAASAYLNWIYVLLCKYNQSQTCPGNR